MPNSKPGMLKARLSLQLYKTWTPEQFLTYLVDYLEYTRPEAEAILAKHLATKLKDGASDPDK